MRKTLDKIATLTLRAILPLTAFLIPLFFLPITPNFFSFNKNYLIFFLASLALICFSLRSVARKQIQLSLSPASFPFLLLTTIFIISSIFQSGNLHSALFDYAAPLISLIIIFITTTSSQKNHPLIKNTFFALLASALLSSLIALYQFSELNAFSSVSWLQNQTFSPLGNPLSLLTLLLPLLPAFIYLVFKTNSVMEKTLYLISSVVFILTIASQISFYLPSDNQTIQLILLPYATGWSIAVDIFKNLRATLLGVGPDNFLVAFTNLRPIAFNLTDYWNTRFSSSSSYLLTLLTTTGIVTTVSFLLAHINTLKLVKQNKPKNNQPYFTATLITLIITLLLLLLIPGNITLVTLNFIALALTILQLKLLTNSPIKDQVFSLIASSQQGSRKTPVLSLIFTFLSILLLIFFWVPATKDYLAARATYQAFNNLNQNTALAYQQLEQAYTLSPSNPTYRTNFAQTSLAIANSLASQENLTEEQKTQITQLIEQTIRESKNAIQLNPYNVIYWENLASIYNQLLNFAEGASDWTIASYSQAINLDPNNPQLRLSLGGVYLALGDYSQASRVFEQAVNLKPNWANARYNLAAAYKADENYGPALEQMQAVLEIINPDSPDYQQVQQEITELEKLVPSSDTTDTQTNQDQTEKNQDIQLVTPTPIPSPSTDIDLPEESGPDEIVLPEEEVDNPESPTPTPTPEV